MKWGIVGYGGFAPKFMKSLVHLNEEIFAIASRSNSGQAQKDYPDARIYSDYEAFFADRDIEIVYVCTTHNFHHDLVIQGLKSGKHVICEKPMGLSEKEVQNMIDVSIKEGRFLMEGLWTRYLPAYQEIKRRIQNDAIGEVVYLTADFGFVTNAQAKKRLFDPNLAGGALYDLGVYPISIANDFLGRPTDIHAKSRKMISGVDENVSMTLHYPHDRTAHLHANLGAKTSNSAVIYGTKGSIKLDLFWMVQDFSVTIDDQTETYRLPFESTGYAHEIKHALECIERGRHEPVLFSHEDSILNARIIDEVIRQI